MTTAERIAAIRNACAGQHGTLGYARRGVASWEIDYLEDWAGRPDALSLAELQRLAEIEVQVFGQRGAHIVQVATT